MNHGLIYAKFLRHGPHEPVSLFLGHQSNPKDMTIDLQNCVEHLGPQLGVDKRITDMENLLATRTYEKWVTDITYHVNQIDAIRHTANEHGVAYILREVCDGRN